MPADRTVLLVFPPAEANYGSGDLKRKDMFFHDANNICPPLGLLYAASVLRSGGWEPRLLDFAAQAITDSRFQSECRKSAVLGIHIQTSQRAAAQRLIRMARAANPSLRIVTGGPDCHSYGRLEDGADLTLAGETECTIGPAFDQLLRPDPDFSAIPGAVYRNDQGRLVSNAIAVPVADLDSVPFPDRSIVQRRSYSLLGAFRGQTTAILTARGCNGACTFCERKFYSFNRYRPRSPENVLDEMREIARLGYRYVYVNDDNFLAQRERAITICEGLVSHPLGLYLKILGRVDDMDDALCALLARAGVRFVDLGLETPSPDVLQFYEKRTDVEQIREAVLACDRHGIFVHGHIMFGAPTETESDLYRTLDMVCELPVDTIFLNILGYRRGSTLWRRAVEAGRIGADEHVVVASRERGLSLYTEDELRRLHGEGTRRFWLRRKLFLRELRKLATTGDLRFRLAMGRILLGLAGSLSRAALGRMVP